MTEHYGDLPDGHDLPLRPDATAEELLRNMTESRDQWRSLAVHQAGRIGELTHLVAQLELLNSQLKIEIRR